jgi:hypothetical protein
VNPVAALALVLGVACLVACLVIVFAWTNSTPVDRRPTAQLRATDAALGPPPPSGDDLWTGMTVIVPNNDLWQAFTAPTQRPGEDDQWSSFTDTVPNIRRLAAAEQATQPVEDIPVPDNPEGTAHP